MKLSFNSLVSRNFAERFLVVLLVALVLVEGNDGFLAKLLWMILDWMILDLLGYFR